MRMVPGYGEIEGWCGRLVRRWDEYADDDDDHILDIRIARSGKSCIENGRGEGRGGLWWFLLSFG
jgi:hypothetical protein